MGSSMEDRVKAGPLLPKWQKVKGRHKALSGKLFKPDIAPAIERYDRTLTDYEAQKKEEVKLKDDIADLIKTGEESSTEIAGYMKELEQVTAKWRQDQGKSLEVLQKYAKSGSEDVSAIEGHLDGLIRAADEYVNNRKRVYDGIDGTAVQNLSRFKKAQKIYGDKAKAVYDARYKLSSEAIDAESEIQGILRDYIDVADDADHPEITKDLQSLKT